MKLKTIVEAVRAALLSQRIRRIHPRYRIYLDARNGAVLEHVRG